jgi:hypothetical protein
MNLLKTVRSFIARALHVDAVLAVVVVELHQSILHLVHYLNSSVRALIHGSYME